MFGISSEKLEKVRAESPAKKGHVLFECSPLGILEPGSSQIQPVAILYSRSGHECQSHCQNVGQSR